MLGLRAIRREDVPNLLPTLVLLLLLRDGAADSVLCCPLTVVPGATVLLMLRILGSGSCGTGGVGGGSILGGAGGSVLSTRPAILSAVGEDSGVGRVSILRGGGAGVGLGLGLDGRHIIKQLLFYDL